MKYYEVYVEPLPLPGEQVEKQRAWKFLAELTESGASEAKAMAAVKEVGGTELRTDFQVSNIRATSVTRSAPELDSANAITSDDAVYGFWRSRFEAVSARNRSGEDSGKLGEIGPNDFVPVLHHLGTRRPNPGKILMPSTPICRKRGLKNQAHECRVATALSIRAFATSGQISRMPSC
jgi:hypothetical protein